MTDEEFDAMSVKERAERLRSIPHWLSAADNLLALARKNFDEAKQCEALVAEALEISRILWRARKGSGSLMTDIIPARDLYAEYQEPTRTRPARLVIFRFYRDPLFKYRERPLRRHDIEIHPVNGILSARRLALELKAEPWNF